MHKSIHHFRLADANTSDQIESGRRTVESTLSVTCHDKHIPDFVEAALEHLYENLYSSLPQLKIYGKLTRQTSTYVVRDGDEIVTLFLFEHCNRHVRVVNEGMKVSAEEMRLFADTIFSRYKSVDIIHFNAIEAPVGQIPFPQQGLDCPCDLVLNLPGTSDEYLASIGKHLRHNIKRSLTRLPADHPSFRIDFYYGEDAEERHIREIIDLNKVRMNQVKRVYKRDKDEVQKVIDLCRLRGLVAVMTINGKVCAGSIGYLVGNSHTGRIIGHDPDYDKYSIGTLCIFLCIRECIARGYKHFNFMSGNNDYKASFGGMPRHLENILVYRSRIRLMLNPAVTARVWSAKIAYQTTLKVQRKLSTLKKMKTEGRLDAGSTLLFFILDHLRTLKDHVSGFTKRS